MKRRFTAILALFVAVSCIGVPAFGAGEAGTTSEGKARDLPILETWSGDYPVSQLKCLPEGQRNSPAGFLGDSAAFTAVWQAFKPGEKVPEIDFSSHLVVFSRNVEFYNRNSIAKVSLEDGVVEVLALETMTSMPIEDKVAMAMAVIPREGVEFIQTPYERIPVTATEAATDPLNAAYAVEGLSVRLVDGCAETEAAPGSAAKIKTCAFGSPVYGDLDDDGDEDAALLLVQNPGGSGTFYYVAAARNVTGAYAGTHAVLLGDRVAPQSFSIDSGVLIANYAGRGPQEPMSARPSLAQSKYLTLRDGVLAEIGALGEGEQVLQGWVTIGHEVRSFRPCSGDTDLWLLGNSPALKEIQAAYHKALPDPKPYSPLFVVLAGAYAPRSSEGFAAQYDSAFYAAQLVKVWPRGNCRSRLSVVDCPAPGAEIASPLSVRGRARRSSGIEGHP